MNGQIYPEGCTYVGKIMPAREEYQELLKKLSRECYAALEKQREDESRRYHSEPQYVHPRGLPSHIKFF